jgi:hypothetical protein
MMSQLGERFDRARVRRMVLGLVAIACAFYAGYSCPGRVEVVYVDRPQPQPEPVSCPGGTGRVGTNVD